MAVVVKTCKHCGKDFRSKASYLAHLPCKEMIDSPDFEQAHRYWVAHYNVYMKFRESKSADAVKGVQPKGSK